MKTLRTSWILRCAACGAHRRLDPGVTVAMWNNKPAVPCTCGAGTMRATILKASHSDHECGAKCLTSKGPHCECSCAGANHGRHA